MGVPRFLQFEGYETADHQTSIRDQIVYIKLTPKDNKPYQCHRCGCALQGIKSQHRLELKDLPLRGFSSIIRLFRRKGHCSVCKKTRSESIAFLAKESPHYTQDYAWWIGTMCEFSPVSRVAEMAGEGNMSVRRIDFNRMRRMLTRYKIPSVTHIAVDEVYARKKKKHPDENRNMRFFTVITDLATKRVVWVSEGRHKKALDEFFTLLGKDACDKIQVVAIDQHDDYRASVKEYCANAKVVWDKFHLLKTFGEAVNEVRKNLHNWRGSKDALAPLTRGKYRFTFLKRDSKRTKKEKDHISEVVEANEEFSSLEIIKERMLSFFDCLTEKDARKVFDEIGQWIKEKAEAANDKPTLESLAFNPLLKWWKNLNLGWDTLKNYFTFRVTSALAEGVNNVIKSLKRRSFGFRNMEYFRFKIMQVCGYLNSRYIKFAEALGT